MMVPIHALQWYRFADTVSVSAVTVSKWCSNITQPTLPNLNRIAEILDVNVKELLNDSKV